MRVFVRNLLLFLSLSTFLGFSSAIQAAEYSVVSAHPAASKAGELMLQQGGNAFDAAVAVSAALAVVEPYGSGIGGGGFWLLHDAKTQRDIVVDGREVAPLAAHKDMYLDAEGKPTDASVNGPLAAGIPGAIAALEHISNQYGKLSFSTALQPAIRLANEGFLPNDRYTRLATFRKKALSNYPAAKDIFFGSR